MKKNLKEGVCLLVNNFYGCEKLNNVEKLDFVSGELIVRHSLTGDRNSLVTWLL